MLPNRRTLIVAGLLVAGSACRPNATPEVVAQGIDEDRIYVVLRQHTVTKPVRATVEPGFIHIFVHQSPPIPTAQIVHCQTNPIQRTITVPIDLPKTRQPARIRVLLDDRSLGDWQTSR